MHLIFFNIFASNWESASKEIFRILGVNIASSFDMLSCVIFEANGVFKISASRSRGFKILLSVTEADDAFEDEEGRISI
jgi:hypothetical protein